MRRRYRSFWRLFLPILGGAVAAHVVAYFGFPYLGLEYPIPLIPHLMESLLEGYNTTRSIKGYIHAH